MVQSARIQQVVKGDDTVLTHQIMKAVAYNAEASRMPDPLGASDLVNFFYALQDPMTTDLFGYPGVPVGAYPTSQFTVPVPGVIIDPLGLSPNRGTSTWLSGPGQTVRAEIQRFQASFTATTTQDTSVLSSVSSVVGLIVGQLIQGPGIPASSYITAIDPIGLTIMISTVATATAVGVAISAYKRETQYMIDEVDIYERGFPSSLCDTSGGVNPPSEPLDLP